VVDPFFGCNREIVGFGKIKLYCLRSDMVIDKVDTDFLRVLTMHRCRKDAVLFYQWRFSFLIFLSKKPLENLTSFGIAVTKRRAHFKPLFRRTVVYGFGLLTYFLLAS
jgi:hypothetical protein